MTAHVVGRNRRGGTVGVVWLPGVRRARHKATVWVPARPEVVIPWLCDPDRRQEAHYADVGGWEIVEGPTFESLTSGGLRVRYTTRYSKWTANVESVDEDRTDRSFSRRIVLVSSRVGTRRSATMVVRMRVNADEARGGASITAHAVAHLVGRARLLVLLGRHDTAYANAMLRQAQDMCQRVSTLVLEEFPAQ